MEKDDAGGGGGGGGAKQHQNTKVPELQNIRTPQHAKHENANATTPYNTTNTRTPPTPEKQNTKTPQSQCQNTKTPPTPKHGNTKT